MSLFNSLGGQRPQNPLELIQQMRTNPAAFLKQSGFNIPADLSDPQAIINHLMQSGQISNQRLQQVMQMIRR